MDMDSTKGASSGFERAWHWYFEVAFEHIRDVPRQTLLLDQ